MKKIFKIYNSVSQNLWFDNPFIEVKNRQELLEFIHKHWDVGSNQVRFEYTNNKGYNNSLIITFEELEKYSEDKL